jgi:predicted enzyme related to lactoylglutathione lyase
MRPVCHARRIARSGDRDAAYVRCCPHAAASWPHTAGVDDGEESMDVFKTHGAFSWNELLTRDPEAARAFYTALFGWGSKTMDMPRGEYTTFQVGETSVAGMMKIPPDAAGMAPAWGSYVTVEDVETTCRRAVELGGKVLVPVTEVPSVGRMAVLQDPQGAVFSIITYAMSNG